MKPSILIVDDEKLIRQSLVNFLSCDYTVYDAPNGVEALRILSENKGIELVLSDVKMPEMDGLELLEKICSGNNDLIVILMTAYFTAELAADVKRRGAYDCLPKPFALTELESTIKNALGKSKGH